MRVLHERPGGGTNRLRRLARYRRWIGAALAVYWTAIFIGTHIPLKAPLHSQSNLDKVVHFAAYFGLAMLLGLWIASRRALRGRDYAAILALITVYAILDELLQIPVNRSADVRDFIADVLGAAAGLGVLRLMLPRSDSA